ncbi:serine/threonine-protein phosphatase 7 long form homolog [Nicotiana sylvestris]|uniref:serine/threonine-protein phosphatase 7 long form homolog n=1 Tax=Nicotiana sylvestris TaxID=4096 RepID=UPI00388C45C2
MDAPIHLGPYSRELLVLQGDHRVLHERVVHRLQATGFYRIIESSRIQVDWALITALIELWRPEMHTFHLPIGEATVTLQDVEVLYGLPVDGIAVSLPIAMRYMSRDHYLDMLHQLTGFRPQDEATSSGASRLALTPIRQHLELLHPDITDDTEEEHITHYMSWGAAVLGYMYRQICRASMATQRDVCGFMPLLQDWAWEWFLQFQPPRPQLPPAIAPPFLPLARSEDLIASLPPYCSAGRHIWSTSAPLICLDIVEHHASERAIGLHTVYQMGLQMRDYIGDAADTLQDYSRRFVELASRTLQRAREDQRLDHMPDYVEPDQNE